MVDFEEFMHYLIYNYFYTKKKNNFKNIQTKKHQSGELQDQ